ncbi:MAG TPA: N-acetyl-gamma-glutamyl-phosphate reductase, partial [Solirubrobacteraceae bacterium]|nr:N-acetyl-gamma-glutamyl-phosphate reductase [Solirubrobacteraceae bacterium]
MADTYRVLVAGASGYAGALAARLVDRHPQLELTAVTSRSDAGRRLDELYPHHRVSRVLDVLDLE